MILHNLDLVTLVDLFEQGEAHNIRELLKLEDDEFILYDGTMTVSDFVARSTYLIELASKATDSTHDLLYVYTVQKTPLMDEHGVCIINAGCNFDKDVVKLCLSQVYQCIRYRQHQVADSFINEFLSYTKLKRPYLDILLTAQELLEDNSYTRLENFIISHGVLV